MTTSIPLTEHFLDTEYAGRTEGSGAADLLYLEYLRADLTLLNNPCKYEIYPQFSHLPSLRDRKENENYQIFLRNHVPDVPEYRRQGIAAALTFSFGLFYSNIHWKCQTALPGWN